MITFIRLRNLFDFEIFKLNTLFSTIRNFSFGVKFIDSRFFHFYFYQYKISIPLSQIRAAKRVKIIFILSMRSGSEAEPESGWAVGEKDVESDGMRTDGDAHVAREGEAPL